MASLKTLLEEGCRCNNGDSNDTHEILKVLQELGSTTISEEGRLSIIKEEIAPSVIQAMLKYSCDAAICEAGCFVLEVGNQSYLRKCGIDDCLTTLLEANIRNPTVCLSCLKVVFSQTLNDEPQVRYDNRGFLKSAKNALDAHPGNFEVSEQAILVLSNLTRFARTLEITDIESYIESVSDALGRYYKKDIEFCESCLETLNALFSFSKPMNMEVKTKILKTVNAALALYCKDGAGNIVDSKMSRLGASSLIRLLDK